MYQLTFLTGNKLPCHDDTSRMKLNIPRSPRDSTPRTPKGRVNLIPKRTNAIGVPAQQPQNPREISGT